MKSNKKLGILTKWVLVTLVCTGIPQIIPSKITLSPLDINLINIFEWINVGTVNHLYLLVCPAVIGWMIRKHYGYKLNISRKQTAIFFIYNVMVGFFSKHLAISIVTRFSNFGIIFVVWSLALIIITTVLWFIQPTFTNHD